MANHWYSYYIYIHLSLWESFLNSRKISLIFTNSLFSALNFQYFRRGFAASIDAKRKSTVAIAPQWETKNGTVGYTGKNGGMKNQFSTFPIPPEEKYSPGNVAEPLQILLLSRFANQTGNFLFFTYYFPPVVSTVCR